jgi:hypothetical protein
MKKIQFTRFTQPDVLWEIGSTTRRWAAMGGNGRLDEHISAHISSYEQ